MESLKPYVADDIWELLLANGADVNKKGAFGETALFHAINSHKTKAVVALIAKGADVNTQKSSRMGTTALELARWKHFDDIVKLLVTAGAK
jgi:ankyrin repeat protein